MIRRQAVPMRRDRAAVPWAMLVLVLTLLARPSALHAQTNEASALTTFAERCLAQIEADTPPERSGLDRLDPAEVAGFVTRTSVRGPISAVYHTPPGEYLLVDTGAKRYCQLYGFDANPGAAAAAWETWLADIDPPFRSAGPFAIRPRTGGAMGLRGGAQAARPHPDGGFVHLAATYLGLGQSGFLGLVAYRTPGDSTAGCALWPEECE